MVKKNKENKTVDKGKSILDLYDHEGNYFDDDTTMDNPDYTVKYIEVSKLEESPDEWNFFKPLDDSRFQMLKESIKTEGLLHPIHVWKYNDRFIILSGHNRVNVFKELYEETNDIIYKKISAKVEEVNTLDEERAKTIVALGNIQRAVTLREQYETIRRYFLYNKEHRGIESNEENYAEIEKRTGKKFRTIQRVLKLERLIPELMDMIGGRDNPMSAHAGEALANFSEANQRFLYKEFKDELTTKSVKGLSSEMTRDEIREYFEVFSKRKEIKKQRKALYIPKELEEEFDELVNSLISKWEKENNIKWKL
jgi:ParB family chromosome partitioning protein